jgi:hypothetical protein
MLLPKQKTSRRDKMGRKADEDHSRLFAGWNGCDKHCGPLASPAQGQTTSGEAESQTTAEQTTTSSPTVGDIVVTAQRRSERLTEVPISVQAVDAQRMSVAAVQNSLDFLGLTPSVNFISGFNPAATTVTIRGISSLAKEGGVQPSTAVIVDDVPYAKQGEFVSDFNDIDHIEILRGPQDTLFGKNATAGVINIVSKKPSDEYEGSIEAGYSTDDEKLVRGIVNIPLGSNVRTRFNAFYRDLSGILPNRAPKVQSDVYRYGNGERSYGFSGKLAVDFDATADMLLSADYHRQVSTFGAIVVLQPNTTAALAAPQYAAGVISSVAHPFLNSDDPVFTTIKGYGFSLALNKQFNDQLRAAPTRGVDLISVLLNAELDNKKITEGNIVMFAMTALAAGSDTTRALLSGIITCFAENPDQWTMLRDRRELVPNAIEEILRWVTPARAFLRNVAIDTEVNGHRINAGEHVYLMYMAANRDASAFVDPHRFDITRKDASRHLAFGAGPHLCAGMRLARIEGVIMLNALLDRFARVEADPCKTYHQQQLEVGAGTFPPIITRMAGRPREPRPTTFVDQDHHPHWDTPRRRQRINRKTE